MNMTDDRKKELEGKITDLEESLSKLKEQLNKEQQEEQHEAINHLEEYLEEVAHRYANLKDFWSIIGQELKELFSKRDSKEKNSGNNDK